MEQYGSMQLEIEVKKENVDDDSFSTTTYCPDSTVIEQPSIKEETVELIIVKTEPEDRDNPTDESVVSILPDAGKCKEEDTNMMVSHTQVQDCEDSSEKCFIYKTETGELCDVIELRGKHVSINSGEK